MPGMIENRGEHKDGIMDVDVGVEWDFVVVVELGGR